MTAGPGDALGRHLRRAALLPDPHDLTDGQLLDRFLAGEPGDPAFEALVKRHGPMVLGVCRRVAGNAHDADDAFQAVFLVLVRRGRELTGRATVGDWLYGVAYRTALKARATAVKRRLKEAAAARPAEAPPAADPPDWLAALDRELDRLPRKYREPLVLCELDGRPRKDVAGRLGIPEGTLSSRLATARKMLADRLRRRGLVAPAGLLAAAGPAAAAVPPGLLDATLAAAAVAVGRAAGSVPAAVAALVSEVTRAMFLAKLRFALLVVPAVLAVGTAGAFALTRPAAPADEKPAARAPDPPAPAKPADPPPAKPPAKAEDDEWGIIGPPRPGELEWKARFRKDYALADGQYLKLVPGPFPEYRAAEKPGLPRMAPTDLVRFEYDGRRFAFRHLAAGAYGWQKEQTRNGIEEQLRGRTLGELVEDVFRIVPPRVDADEEFLRKTEVYADVVMREGATPDQLAAWLGAELREKFKLPVGVIGREEEREVVVFRGKYVHKPRPGQLNGTVDISPTPLPEEYDTASMGAYYGGGIDMLFARLGWSIGRPVVNEVDPKSWQMEMVGKRDEWKGYFGCRWPRRARADVRPADVSADRDAVLKHIADQTGLTYTTEKRRVWILSITKAEK